MQAIDDALYQFRLANNRLPCPGDLYVTSGDLTTGTYYNTFKGADYGFEAGADPKSATAAGRGSCASMFTSNMTPSANLIAQYQGVIPSMQAAEGSVPARTLKLPDSYMYDGWGNHIRYVVDINATANNAFISSPEMYLNVCGLIMICDATGRNSSTGACNNPRSNGAVYALLSHGANGVGAFSQNGIMSPTTSSNTNELLNCHSYSAGNACLTPTTTRGYESWYPIYVQQAPAYQSGNTGSTPYYFDDILTFKERWQLQSPLDGNPPPAPGNGFGLILGGSDAKLYPYQQNGAVFSYVSNQPSAGSQPSSSFSTLGQVAFSSDNTLMAVAGTAGGSGYPPSWIIYTVASATITTSNRSSNFTPGTSSTGVSFSRDRRFIALAGPSQGYTGYCTGITLILPGENVNVGPTLSNTQVVLYSADGQYLATSSSTGVIYVYNALNSTASTNCTVSSYMGPSSPPGGITAVSAISFSNDDKYLAISATVSGVAKVLVYQTTGGSLSLVSTLTPGGTAAMGAAFSHSGNTLAVTSNAYPYLFFYTNNRDGTFSAFSTVTVSAGANANALAWSRDDQFVAIANGATDKGDSNACGAGYGWCGLALYQVIGTTVNPLGAVTTPPGPINNAKHDLDCIYELNTLCRVFLHSFFQRPKSATFCSRRLRNAFVSAWWSDSSLSQ